MIRITGLNYIGGKPGEKSDNTFPAINPKTMEASSISFSNATDQEIDQAVQKAKTSFSALKYFSNEKKAQFLSDLSSEINVLGQQLIDTGSWETALPKTRLENERMRTCNQIEMFASIVEKGDYVEAVIDVSDTNGSFDIRRMLIPLGPVLVFPASNFPFAFGVCGGDTISAFAAGCPVIVKAHPSHPQTSELFAHAVYKAIEKTGFPKEMFSLLHANKPETIKELIMQPDLEAIGFTGSLHAGRMIFDFACSRKKPIPVFAEMGSINPVIITTHALQKRKEMIASMLADSICLGCGQFCTKPGVIFIPDKDEGFSTLLTEKINTKESGVMLNKKILEQYSQSIDQIHKTDNITVLTRNNESDINTARPSLFLTDSTTYQNHTDLQLEHFGPTAILITYKTKKDLSSLINGLDGQLTATLHFTDEDYSEMKEIINLLQEKVGRIICNGVPTGVEVCYAMQHGGPYPATTAPDTTSVGMYAIKRFLRPIAYQNIPDTLLPRKLQNTNHDNILRLVNTSYTRKDIQ